jgi:hypothetical protein
LSEATDRVWTEDCRLHHQVCGITNAVDGSEDDEIHCFKVHGAIPTGRILLQKARLVKETDTHKTFGVKSDQTLKRNTKLVLV